MTEGVSALRHALSNACLSNCRRAALSSGSRPELVAADALRVLPQQARLLKDVHRRGVEQLALNAVVICATGAVSVGMHG